MLTVSDVQLTAVLSLAIWLSMLMVVVMLSVVMYMVLQLFVFAEPYHHVYIVMGQQVVCDVVPF